MTARDQARRAAVDGRARAARPAIEAVHGPPLPERLFTARERKGVDLYRAERDTKIRAHYLAALERGDYDDLPGSVYTKGFLRNYALYLGLDPEDVLLQWRLERGVPEPTETVVPVAKPIDTRPRGLTFSPGVIVAALMTVGVIAFGAYLAVQLLRFAKPPTLAVTDPAVALVEVDEQTTSYVIAGSSIPGATISVTTPGRSQPYRVTAGPDGTWSVQVDLRRGKNQFDVTATDPETGKQAETPRQVFITVPFLVIQAPTLAVDQPAEGTTFENGAIPVEGRTTNATMVTVTAVYLGPVDGQPVIVTPAPSLEPGATPPPDPGPTPIEAAVADDGTFATPLELTEGRWAITITATSEQGKAASLTRNVAVAFEGVNLVVTIKGGPAWLKVWTDGLLDPSIPASGISLSSGKTLTFTGKESVEVRTGSSGVTYFTLNGTSLGALGRPGIPETWLFAPPDPPVKTQRR